MNLLHGAVHMSDHELDLLARTVAAATGDHLEIGTCWGGSAIVACSAMEQAGRDGKVVCIDPFVFNSGWPPEGKPTPALVRENFEEAGFADRLELHVCLSAPWPFPTGRKFGTVLIDGDHQAPWPETDWESARCVTDTILLHDVNWHEPDIAQLHGRIIADPVWADGSRWRIREYAKFLYVYEKVPPV